MITDSEPGLAASAAPDIEPQTGPRSSASACVAHRDTIELGLSRGRNAMAIWQDLVDTCGFAAGYQSVRRFVRKLEENSSPQARVVILMAPGEQAQVDFGEGPMVREPHSGKCRRTRLFVLTLGAAANPSACWCSDPVHRSGPSYTRRRSAVLEASPGSSCWTILREGVLAPDIYVSRQVRTGSCPECGSYGRFEVTRMAGFEVITEESAGFGALSRNSMKWLIGAGFTVAAYRLRATSSRLQPPLDGGRRG